MSVQRRFYRDLYKWITQDNGGPNFHGFHWHTGLCFNYSIWAKTHKKKKHSMLNDFIRARFKNAYYPFNGNFIHYDNESSNGTVYANPKRLKWIKDHC